MKKLKKFLSASKTNVAIFVVTTGLVLSATIGAASATVVYLVEDYTERTLIYDIGVTLVENDTNISWRDYKSAWIGSDGAGKWDEHTGDLLQNMLAKGENLALGKPYTEKLSIRNSGTLDEYVRVSIYKYWIDADGNKLTNLNPDYIELNVLSDTTGSNSGWVEDRSSYTTERTVLYYNSLLLSGAETPLFADGLKISSAVAGQPDLYKDAKFIVEVKIDTVQDTAGTNPWTGITVDDVGTLSLG